MATSILAGDRRPHVEARAVFYLERSPLSSWVGRAWALAALSGASEQFCQVIIDAACRAAQVPSVRRWQPPTLTRGTT